MWHNKLYNVYDGLCDGGWLVWYTCDAVLVKPCAAHVGLEVWAQTSWLCERPATHPALVGLFPSVQSFVTPQRASLAKSPWAELAFVWPLSRVNPRMCPQAPLWIELSVTPGTLPPTPILATHEHAVEQLVLWAPTCPPSVTRLSSGVCGCVYGTTWARPLFPQPWLSS